MGQKDVRHLLHFHCSVTTLRKLKLDPWDSVGHQSKILQLLFSKQPRSRQGKSMSLLRTVSSVVRRLVVNMKGSEFGHSQHKRLPVAKQSALSFFALSFGNKLL